MTNGQKLAGFSTLFGFIFGAGGGGLLWAMDCGYASSDDSFAFFGSAVLCALSILCFAASIVKWLEKEAR